MGMNDTNLRGSARWGEEAIYKQYLREVSRYPLLTSAEEKALLRLVAEGNKQALDRLVLGNLRFVINIAFCYTGQGLSANELINEGNLGLIEAAQRFEPDRDIKFISYAVWWIRQSITRAIAEKARLVRISAEKELVLRRFAASSHGVRQTVGGQYVPDAEELGRKFGYTPGQVEEIVKMGLRHASLDAPVGEDDDCTLLDLATSEAPEAEALAEAESEKAALREAVSKLPEIERKVLGLYYGLDRPDPINLVEIGKIIGLSKERTRQMKERGLLHLREMGVALKLGRAA